MPDLENYGAQATPAPADCAELLRIIDLRVSPVTTWLKSLPRGEVFEEDLAGFAVFLGLHGAELGPLFG
jgi:hypothetical protein